MKINTGKGYISLMTIVSILTLELVINIPGLAITPVIGSIKKVFHATDLEVQLLTMLPNICIIPFMLISNKLIVIFNKTIVTISSLIVFTLSGISFFLTKNIGVMIFLSCLLGAASGIIIPISASFLTDLFVGKYRVKILGIKSGISNLSLVFATFIVGWLASGGSWRLPFLVYLIPLVPLAFSRGLYTAERLSDWKNKPAPANAPANENTQYGLLKKIGAGIDIKKIAGLMGFYFFATYLIIVLPYYLGLDETVLHITNEWNSTITSILYLSIFLAGTSLFIVIRHLKQWTIIVAVALITIGLFFIVQPIPPELMCVCSALMGFGYGLIQPIMYNKTVEAVYDDRKTTFALSLVLSVNYFTIAVTPLIVKTVQLVFHSSSDIFPFYLNAALGAIFIIFIFIKRSSFTFAVKKDYYS